MEIDKVPEGVLSEGALSEEDVRVASHDMHVALETAHVREAFKDGANKGVCECGSDISHRPTWVRRCRLCQSALETSEKRRRPSAVGQRLVDKYL